MGKYFLYDGQNQLGPFDKLQLKEKSITKNTPVWYEGLAEWTNAGDVLELNDIFITPPPFKKNEPILTPPKIDNLQTNNHSQSETPNSRISKNKFTPTRINYLIGISIVLLVGMYFVFQKFKSDTMNADNTNITPNQATVVIPTQSDTIKKTLYTEPEKPKIKVEDKSSSTTSEQNKQTNTDNTVELIRFFNGQDYLYTTNRNEGIRGGYKFEGIIGYAFNSQESSTVPCYRFYSSSLSDHFYSTDLYEGTRAGYINEGAQWHIYTSKKDGTIPLYRFFNGTNHFYATNLNEGTSAGFKYEGILGYILRNRD